MNNFIVLKRILALVCLSSCYLIQQQAFAQDSSPDNHERMYQIEMIIFSRHETNPQEAWPKDIKLSYPDNLVFLKSGDSNSQESFTMLPVSERKLNSQAATIAKSGSYTLLFHQAWRQMIYARNTHIFISGGKTFNGHQELEGSISISVATYLKFQTNLWLTQFAPASASPTTMTIQTPEATAINESWPQLPALPASNFEADANTNNQPQDYVTKRIVKINQQRSMRSIEVHYIDHPLLGIIIKIVPYKADNE